MRPWSALVSLALLASAAAQKPAKLATARAAFNDPTDGITFKYPADWKRVQGPDDYCENGATFGRGPDQLHPVAALEFRGNGTTSLSSLDFSFGMAKSADADACRGFAHSVGSGSGFTPNVTMIHGVAFEHGQGGDCGLGHGLSEDLYTTWRDNRCFAFAEDFFTARPDGARDLTEQEMKTLELRLDTIMQSVRFNSPTKP